MASQPPHIEVISKELVKPSSPTPDHHRIHKLSLIDQIMPPVYIGIVFFYKFDQVKRWPHNNGIGKNLKESLSSTLNSFYPLAGSLHMEDASVICDDSGVGFAEARAHGRVMDIMKDPNMGQLEQYVYVNPAGGVFCGNGTLFTVQINYLDCGGIAIGTRQAHLIGDAASLFQFMNAWAATSRGQKWATPPEFGPLGDWLPSRDLSPDAIMGPKGEFTTRRFVFDRHRLSLIKSAAASGGEISPTTVESLSAFIIQNFIENKLPEGKTRFGAAHMVNVRPRAGKLLNLEHAFGNGAIPTTAVIDLSGDGGRIPAPTMLASALRRAIGKIDKEYIETRMRLHYLSDVSEMTSLARRGVVEEVLAFSSWWRFPTYEVDFGWGRPEWVCTTGLEINNLAIFMGTKDGDGIEAWINSTPENLMSLENKLETMGSGN